MKFDHDRQCLTLQLLLLTVDCISRLSGPVTFIVEIGGTSEMVHNVVNIILAILKCISGCNCNMWSVLVCFYTTFY